MSRPPISIAEPRVSLCDTIADYLLNAGYRPVPTNTLNLLRDVHTRDSEMVIVGPSLADISTLRTIAKQIRESWFWIPVLLLAPNSSEELAIAALKAGVSDYLRFPCSAQELGAAVTKCLRERAVRGRARPWGYSASEDARMIGESQAMRNVKASLCRIASTDSNILITGETGTGKELAAEFVHRQSSRRDSPFITVNCAAIPDNLLESELFGYERGAFTGAESSRDGKLKAADGGTVFLDEIGDMSAFAQAKILRAIDSKEIQRLGGSGTSVNVRIVAATNQELETLVREDRFRKDLYFRLNVARVHLPPLRERKEDLPPIVNHYMDYFNALFGRQVERLGDAAWEYFLAYDWPGNIRELKNLLEGIFIHTSSSEIQSAELPRHLRENCGQTPRLPEDERKRLLSALMETDWNKSKAADKLRWSRMTLYRKIAKYRVTRSCASGV